MKRNMGVADRLVRTLLAIVAVVLLLTKAVHGYLTVILGILAIILLLTAVVGLCPVYILLGVSTRPGRPDSKLPPQS